jgi:hypothetical protein
MEYNYTTGSDLQDLAYEVNRMMKESWSPIGEIVIDYGLENARMFSGEHAGLRLNYKRYIQTMVKGE